MNTTHYPMKKERLQFLFKLYIDQRITPEENKELIQLMAEPANDDEREKLISEYYDRLPETHKLKKAVSDRLFQQIIEKPVIKLSTTTEKRNKLLRWTSVAAAVALLLITVNILVFRKNSPVDEINKVVRVTKTIKKEKPLYKNDIKAGGDQATLTLADGSTIVLGDASKGSLSRQGDADIIKLDSGSISYQLQNILQTTSKAVLYNTLSTPRGGQFNITLADGTMVWLNASTSLKFPVAFTGKERKVEVNGEAYFEVAKNEAMPFIVKAGNEEIKVLGTHFNVSAYADDKIVKTTLLEGKVEVSLTNLKDTDAALSTLTLMPGQQARLDKDNTLKVIDANLEEAVAWKNGYFIFLNEDLESIMLKISRWYDVNVIFEMENDGERFTGNISRKKNVSEVLSMLEQTEAVHFKIENKTIIVVK